MALSEVTCHCIAEALKTNHTLTKLTFTNGRHSDIKIGPKGARALASMLEVNTAVKALDLRANERDQAAKDAVKAAWNGTEYTSEPTTPEGTFQIAFPAPHLSGGRLIDWSILDSGSFQLILLRMPTPS